LFPGPEVLGHEIKNCMGNCKKIFSTGFLPLFIKKMACVALLPYLSEIMITRSVIICHLVRTLQFLVSARIQVA
jgi:hypothetical protein